MEATAPPNAEPLFGKPWRLLAAVLLVALALRAAILFTGQRYLRSDEAVVGLMAKHILTRGERPIFLYGQAYGGGHAIGAYITAPLFALFGISAVLLTGVPAALSLVNVALVWHIMRRYFGVRVAAVAAFLYSLSPPAVYGAFLVNGGTESACLALLALRFFLRAYLDEERPRLNMAAAGILAGLAYYAMDYALLYPLVFGALLVVAKGPKRQLLFLLVPAFLAGCLPLIWFNLAHDFAHWQQMTRLPREMDAPFGGHFFAALAHAVGEGLACFFTGDIDDYRQPTVGGWVHAVAAMAAVLFLAWDTRKPLVQYAKRFASPDAQPERFPAAAIPLFFIASYMAVYALAKFSLPALRTPRYFLPLCPFASMTIALAMLRERRPFLLHAGRVIVILLLMHGVVASLRVGMRPWHEEHRIRTSGAEIEKLATLLQREGITLAGAPYEIQARLLFASDEAVTLSCSGLSPLPRYGWYEQEFQRRWMEGERFALIARKDFAFIALGIGAPPEATARHFQSLLRSKGFADTPALETPEFAVFWPLDGRMFR